LLLIDDGVDMIESQPVVDGELAVFIDAIRFPTPAKRRR